MIQQKQVLKNCNKKGVTSKDSELLSKNFIFYPQKNRTIIKPEENKNLPGLDYNS